MSERTFEDIDVPNRNKIPLIRWLLIVKHIYLTRPLIEFQFDSELKTCTYRSSIAEIMVRLRVKNVLCSDEILTRYLQNIKKIGFDYLSTFENIENWRKNQYFRCFANISSEFHQRVETISPLNSARFSFFEYIKNLRLTKLSIWSQYSVP